MGICEIVEQACWSCFMTFEIQAFTVLLLMALLQNYLETKIPGLPLLQIYKKSLILTIGQFRGLLVPEVFNFTFSGVLKAKQGQHNIMYSTRL